MNAVERGHTLATHRRKGDGPGRTLKATAALVWSQANGRPHFSVQGEELTRGRVEACGCLHEMVAKHWPELAPVIRVHLADDHGVPMHAEANALHWFGFSTWGRGAGAPMPPDDDYGRRTLETAADGLTWAPQTAADHLRVDVDTVRELRERIATATSGALRAVVMAEITVELAPAWQTEADEALRIIRGDL